MKFKGLAVLGILLAVLSSSGVREDVGFVRRLDTRYR